MMCLNPHIPDKPCRRTTCNLVDYLDRAHAQQRLYLRFDGTSMTSPIAPAVGVMQGDTLAPYLFILVVDQILRSLDYEAGVPVHTSNLRAPLKVAALAYADDVVLTCPSLEQAQRLFEDAALLWGLHLNTKKGKTELLIATTRSRRDSAPDFLQCRAGVVGRTHSYRYLGWLVTDRGAQDWKEDFAHRTRLAWATLHTNERLWRSPASARTKTRLFNALVVPILTYAFWAYPISADCILHVHVTANKLLRHALGIRVEFSDPDLHTHTEDLYVHSPFVPLSAHASLLRQWGHWVRAAARRPFLDPVVTVLTGTQHKDAAVENASRRPSQNLRHLLDASEHDLLEWPMNRAAWRRKSSDAFRRLARTMSTWVTTRRLRSENDNGYSYDWNPRIERWISDAQAR
eukprot:PhM_4_TR8460/c4_g1_i3/m.47271